MADLRKYEVAIHNAEVRKLVQEGERHKRLTDDWAETHYVEVKARNEDEVRSKIEDRYPKARGFVINHITPLD